MKIILKAEFTKPREVTVGTKTIKATPGKAVEVDLADVDLWLGSGRFEIAADEQPATADKPKTSTTAKAKDGGEK